MKMETAIYAEHDGLIEELLVKAGDQIDAKDLMLRYSLAISQPSP
jgi:pyruvate carboxylase